MIRLLFLLLPLLTDRVALMETFRCCVTFAAVNTGILCFLGALEAVRCLKRNLRMAESLTSDRR